MRPSAVDRIANLSAQLHHGLVHLRLDLLLEEDLSSLENFMDMRAQLPRFRIDDRKLLFDTQGECVVLRAHDGSVLSEDGDCGQQMSARNAALSSRSGRTVSHHFMMRNFAASVVFHGAFNP